MNHHVLFVLMGDYVTIEHMLTLIEMVTGGLTVGEETVAISEDRTHASASVFLPTENFQLARKYLKQFDLEIEINELKFQMVWM